MPTSSLRGSSPNKNKLPGNGSNNKEKEDGEGGGVEEEGGREAGVAQVLLHFRQVMKFRKKLIGKAQGPATK